MFLQLFVVNKSGGLIYNQVGIGANYVLSTFGSQNTNINFPLVDQNIEFELSSSFEYVRILVQKHARSRYVPRVGIISYTGHAIGRYHSSEQQSVHLLYSMFSSCKTFGEVTFDFCPLLPFCSNDCSVLSVVGACSFTQPRTCLLLPRGLPATTGFDWGPRSTACTPSRRRYDMYGYTLFHVYICQLYISYAREELPAVPQTRQRSATTITPHIATLPFYGGATTGSREMVVSARSLFRSFLRVIPVL